MKTTDFNSTMRSTEKDECFEMSLGDYTATVFKPRRGKKITLSNGVHTVAWEYATKPSADEDGVKKKRPRVALERSEQGEHERFTYRNIDTATDLEYILDRKGIKENIIVKARSDEYRYTFLLRTGDLSVRVSEDDGALELYEAKSGENAKTLFTIPAPFMTDADGARSDDVWYELEESTKGKYTFTVVADNAWINDSYRAFPVTVDPQLIIQENLEDNGLTLETEEELTLIGGDAAGGVATPFTLPPDWDGGGGGTGSYIPVRAIYFDTHNIALDMGEYCHITASVYPANASNPELTWYSEDPDIVSVSYDGTIFARGIGTTSIYAVANDYSAVQSDYCTICVVSGNPVTSIELSQSSAELFVGESMELRATVRPSYASIRDVAFSPYHSCVTLEKIGEQVVRLTGKYPGKSTITAYAQDNSNQRDTCDVTVLEFIAVESVTLSETSKDLKPGEKFTLATTVYPENAHYQTITWNSSDSTVASVDADGVVTAHSDGIAFITATAGGKTSVACRIRIDSRERVEIVSDPLDDDFNIVRFTSSGKVWHCVDHDLIFSTSDDYMLGQYSYLNTRAMLNCAETNGSGQVYYDTIKTYTDDELKLLYAIDPLGVAYYVDWYSKKSPTINDLETTIWGYKNQIFRILFGRDPIYLAENIDGEWDRTYATPDTTTMLSESELYFGIHFTFNWSKINGIIIDCIAHLIGALASRFAGTLFAEYVKIALRIFAIGEAAVKSDLLNGVSAEAFDEVLGNTELNWIDKINTTYFACTTIWELAEALTREVNFYGDYIHYTANDVNYRVFLKIGNDFIEMADIDEALIALENN